MRRRNLFIVLAVVLVLAAAIVTYFLRRNQPPLAARFLPAADAYLYIDLRPLRAAGVFKNGISPDPEYAQFVADTGFQFERDLDQAAFAVHLPSTVDLATSKTTPETRYSEVFVGRFDHAKLATYLQKTAAASRPYGSTIIYAIPLPGRTVRVAVLSKNMAAASNTDGEFVILNIVDRYRQTFSPGENDLLHRYYRHVPLGSVAWSVARTASAGEQGNARFVLPGGYDLFFPPETVLVASVRYLGSLQFRADAFTRTPEEAQRVSDQLNAFLAIARTIEVRAQSEVADPDLNRFFDSITVSQLQDHAELNATVPPGFLKKIVSEPPPVITQPNPPQKKSEVRKHRGKRSKK